MTKTELLWDVCRKVEQLLNDNHVNVYSVYPHPEGLPVIQVEINGDWKHDHLLGKHLIEQEFGDNLSIIGSRELGNSMSDFYHGVHNYIYMK